MATIHEGAKGEIDRLLDFYDTRPPEQRPVKVPVALTMEGVLRAIGMTPPEDPKAIVRVTYRGYVLDPLRKPTRGH